MVVEAFVVCERVVYPVDGIGGGRKSRILREHLGFDALKIVSSTSNL